MVRSSLIRKLTSEQESMFINRGVININSLNIMSIYSSELSFEYIYIYIYIQSRFVLLSDFFVLFTPNLLS
jgi:hypothetical protein